MGPSGPKHTSGKAGHPRSRRTCRNLLILLLDGLATFLPLLFDGLAAFLILLLRLLLLDLTR